MPRTSTAAPASAGRVRQRVGPSIKALRVKAGMSLNDLADQAGISPSHLSRMERGLTVPSYDVLDRVAHALGSDLNQMRQQEVQAREVDSELFDILDSAGLSRPTQDELLTLSHSARSDLAAALKRRSSSN